jgi:four helix bundle protein
MGYHDLEIWKIANDLVNDIHEMTINDLPKFEMFESGSQIRRSAKSIKSNIVEGYGRRKYKKESSKQKVIEHRTSNIEHRISNIEHQKKRGNRSPLFLIPFKDGYFVTVIFTVFVPFPVDTFTK